MFWMVEVLDNKERPVSGIRISTLFTSLFRGALEEFTDSSGHASFGFDDCKEGEAKIYVNGKTFGPYYIRDGEGFTVIFD